MIIRRLTPEEYEATAGKHTTHAYNTVAFARLNAHKCDDVHFLLFADTKPRFGLILGERAGTLHSPFSAPFGGFDAFGSQRISHYRDAVAALREYAAGRPVEITAPPLLYAPDHITRATAALLEAGARQLAEVNHHYDLTDTRPQPERLSRNARKNLNAALRTSLTFKSIENRGGKDFAAVYDVIRLNRQHRNHPLRMSLDEIMATAPLMDADLFLVTLGDENVAAAYVHHSAPGVAQIVYWGDAPGYSHLRPMNFLAYYLFRHYSGLRFRTVDIGISTDRGTIDPGLCDFKESLGCTPTLRPTLTI